MALADLKAKFEAAKKQIADESSAALAAEIKQMFKDNPKVESIRWNQYTPYFNDGDPCVFSVKDLYYKPEGGDEDGGDYEDGYFDAEYSKDPVAVPVGKWWNSIQLDEAFLAAFGDHVRITATRDQIEVDEYDHD
jgi:hypothetical protein